MAKYSQTTKKADYKTIHTVSPYFLLKSRKRPE